MGAAGLIFTDEEGDMHYTEPIWFRLQRKWVEDRKPKTWDLLIKDVHKFKYITPITLLHVCNPEIQSYTLSQSLAEREASMGRPRMGWRLSPNLRLEGAA